VYITKILINHNKLLTFIVEPKDFIKISFAGGVDVPITEDERFMTINLIDSNRTEALIIYDYYTHL